MSSPVHISSIRNSSSRQTQEHTWQNGQISKRIQTFLWCSQNLKTLNLQIVPNLSTYVTSRLGKKDKKVVRQPWAQSWRWYIQGNEWQCEWYRSMGMVSHRVVIYWLQLRKSTLCWLLTQWIRAGGKFYHRSLAPRDHYLTHIEFIRCVGACTQGCRVAGAFRW